MSKVYRINYTNGDHMDYPYDGRDLIKLWDDFEEQQDLISTICILVVDNHLGISLRGTPNE